VLKKGKYSQFALNIRCSLYLSCGQFLVNNVIETWLFPSLRSFSDNYKSLETWFPPSRIGINFGAISMNSIQDANSNKTRKRSPMFKILIVDPNDPFRQSLKKVLVNRFPSVDIQEAADGNEGLQKVEDFHPNLIFVEIHLPAETGLDLAGRIKADHPDIIIVILTSYDLPEYQTAAEQLIWLIERFL
jgi:CheY-like chemotaxis protein